jgi:hypothetical protein
MFGSTYAPDPARDAGSRINIDKILARKGLIVNSIYSYNSVSRILTQQLG